MDAKTRTSIWRVEALHALCLLATLALLSGAGAVDARSALLGGVFMGVNFLLLSYGAAWLLGLGGGPGRARLAAALLALKVVLFLALLTAAFRFLDFDALSFALGFSTLLLALLIEALRSGLAT